VETLYSLARHARNAPAVTRFILQPPSAALINRLEFAFRWLGQITLLAYTGIPPLGVLPPTLSPATLRPPMKTLSFLCAVILATLAGCASPHAQTHAEKKIKVLILTGGHAFKAEPFFKMFADNLQITYTAATQHTNAEAYDRADLFTYDVVLLYDSPTQISDAQKARFLALFDKGIGVIVLHHAYLSYPMWDDYERIAGGKYIYQTEQMINGIKSSTYKGDIDIPITVVAEDHPITAGLPENFILHDEHYWNLHMLNNATPLLKSSDDQWIAWYRTEKKSRVFGTIVGHGCYEDPNFQKLIAQSINWVAKR
jgi:type 1 glutamine amidotransferase